MKILLADDQLLFVESLKIVLESRAEDLTIVGIALDGREAVEAARKERPDLVLMDVHMPGVDGVEATKILHGEFPEMKILMLTTFDNDEYVAQAIHHGASGYILKDILPEDLIDSIRAVHRGRMLMSPKVASKVADHVLQQYKDPPAEEGMREKYSSYVTLTKREREIFRLIAAGYDNKEISSRLYIAEQTVKNHVREIYSKLNIHDRLHVIRMARLLGIE